MQNEQRERQRWQNTVNNAQGRFFEDAIKAACNIYKEEERACIDKIPEPFRVLEKNYQGYFRGRFTAHAQPDFQGTLKSGRSIVFEAKYTTTDRLKWDVLTAEQQNALELHAKHGAVAAVCAGIRDEFFFIPWTVWKDMKQRFGHKYVTIQDLKPWRVKCSRAILFLDYKN